MNTLSRRGFVAAGAAMLAPAHLPRIAAAQGLAGSAEQGLALDPGARFHHTPHLETGMMTEFAVSA